MGKPYRHPAGPARDRRQRLSGKQLNRRRNNLRDGRHYITAGTHVTLRPIESDVPEHVFLKLTNDQSIKPIASRRMEIWFAAGDSKGSGDSEGTLRVWPLSEHKELVSKKLYPTDVIQIAISPDSQELATIRCDDEITIWSVDQLQQKNRFKDNTNGLQRSIL